MTKKKIECSWKSIVHYALRKSVPSEPIANASPVSAQLNSTGECRGNQRVRAQASTWSQAPAQGRPAYPATPITICEMSAPSETQLPATAKHRGKHYYETVVFEVSDARCLDVTGIGSNRNVRDALGRGIHPPRTSTWSRGVLWPVS